MDALKPIKAPSMKESAYASLEAAIVRCDLAPGMLLSDRQLSEALGISRTPVREALQSLASADLVARRGRVGWMVAGFDRQDVRELYELRRVLEPLGLERLASGWEREATEELAGFFEGFPAPLPRERYEEYMQRDHAFHKRIVGHSANSRVIRFYAVVEKQIDRIRHYLAPGYRGRMNDVVEEHRRICAAIAARDLPAAREMLLDHLGAGERAMIEFLGEEGLGAHPAREQAGMP